MSKNKKDKIILRSLIRSLIVVAVAFLLWYLYSYNTPFRTFINDTFNLETQKETDSPKIEETKKSNIVIEGKEIKFNGEIFIEIDENALLKLVGGKENLLNIEAENRIHKSSEVNLDDLIKTHCFKVTDGDTIKVVYQDKYALTLRLIGVDTPEKYPSRKSDYKVEYFGKEASNFTKKIVHNKDTYLAFGSSLTDVYDRFLTYVYLENGECLNAVIIKEGYGFAYRKYPHKFMDEFIKYENQARQSDKGLWANEEKID